MKPTRLILVMIMIANSLDDVIEKKEVQIQKEKFEYTNIPRKLGENTNYITLIFNQDCIFTWKNTNIIDKIINNGDEISKIQEIKVKKDTEIQIHFIIKLSDCSSFFIKNIETVINKIASVDFSKFDSSNLNAIRYMFEECKYLKSINFSNFNTSKIGSFQKIFFGCSSLKELDLSHFDISRATDISGFFEGCSSLEKLDLSNFNTSNVKTMDRLFYGCSSLKELNLSNFNTDNVTNIEECFLILHH